MAAPAGSSNGRTPDSGSGSLGSSPSPAAFRKPPLRRLFRCRSSLRVSEVRMDETHSPLILWQLSERLRLREALTGLYRVRVVGAENVPAGGCILVGNHESVIDPWFLSLATQRRVRFMAKAELWRYRPVRWAMEAYGTFPVERGSGDPGAMARAGELLDGGEVLGMFPRGTSKPAGNRVWH